MADFPLLLPPILLPRYLKYTKHLDLCNKLRILNMLYGAGLLFALYLAAMEMIYKKVYCYSRVMEMQLVREIVATALSTFGMASDWEYTEIKREGQMIYDKRPAIYCLTIIGNVVMRQLLHGYCGDGVLDVVVDGRDLHDDDFGHECNWTGLMATALAALRRFRLCFVLGAFALMCMACNFIEILEIDENIEGCYIKTCE